jgi:hypothetical protein
MKTSKGQRHRQTTEERAAGKTQQQAKANATGKQPKNAPQAKGRLQDKSH